MPPDAIESFITRWENSGAAERANYQMFLSELCDNSNAPSTKAAATSPRFPSPRVARRYDKSVVTPDAESLSALFGRKNKKRIEQIEGILETLKGLGQL